MKGLVLAGGRGTRLKPLTTTMTKQLVPVANKPILFYVLDQIRGRRHHRYRHHHRAGDRPVDKGCRRRRFPLGRQDHLYPAIGAQGAGPRREDRPGLPGKNPFLMFLGDNLVQKGITRFVKEYKRNAATVDSLILLKEVKETHLFGIAELDARGVSSTSRRSRNRPRATWLSSAFTFSHQSSTRPSARSSHPGGANSRSPMPSRRSSTWARTSTAISWTDGGWTRAKRTTSSRPTGSCWMSS